MPTHNRHISSKSQPKTGFGKRYNIYCDINDTKPINKFPCLLISVILIHVKFFMTQTQVRSCNMPSDKCKIVIFKEYKDKDNNFVILS